MFTMAGDAIRRYAHIVMGFSRNAKLLLLVLALIGVSYGSFTTIFVLYVIEINFDEAFLGRLIATGAVAAALTAIPAGLLIDRIGARNGLLIGAAVGAAGVVLLLSVTTAWVMLLSVIVVAVGVALIYVAQAPFIATWSAEEERTYLFSVAAAVFVLAGIGGSLFSGIAPGEFRGIWPDLSVASSYRVTLLISGAISALSLLPLVRMRILSQPSGVLPGREVAKKAFESFAVRRLALTGLLLSLGGGMIVPFFNVFFQQELGASTEMVSVARVAGITASVLGTLMAPWASGYLGLVGAVMAARFFSAPFLLAIGLAPVLALAVAFMSARTFLAYLTGPLYADFSMRIVPHEIRGTTSSVTFMSWNLTLALGSWLGGWLIMSQGYTFVFLLSSSITLIAAASYWLAFRSYEE